MLFITQEELENQSVPGKEPSQIIFQNKLLTKGPIISKNSREEAAKLCQTYSDDNRLCLIVENQWYLTVWIENADTSIPTKDGGKFDDLPQEKSLPLRQASTQKPSLNKSGGISSEDGDNFEKLPEENSPPLRQASAKKRPPRTYRGIPY